MIDGLNDGSESVTTTRVINSEGEQHVRVPDEFKLEVSEVTIRREGDALILEPVPTKSESWPKDFFDSIRIDDPAFERPNQGIVPPAPRMDI